MAAGMQRRAVRTADPRTRPRRAYPLDRRGNGLPNDGRRLALLAVHLRRERALLHERSAREEEPTYRDQHREERPLDAFAVVGPDDHPRPTRRTQAPEGAFLLCA